jgi:hypothetical protein
MAYQPITRRVPPSSTDEHLNRIASILDDMFRIPGTEIRFGLDFLIGWIPGLGDAAAGIASLIIIVAAWRRGSPLITLARMATNVILETWLGSIPVIGDIFHVAWKANRRNYRLFMREQNTAPGENNAWRDVLFFVMLLVAALCLIAVPIVFAVWLIRSLLYFHR